MLLLPHGFPVPHCPLLSSVCQELVTVRKESVIYADTWTWNRCPGISPSICEREPYLPERPTLTTAWTLLSTPGHEGTDGTPRSHHWSWPTGFHGFIILITMFIIHWAVNMNDHALCNVNCYVTYSCDQLIDHVQVNIGTHFFHIFCTKRTGIWQQNN